MFFEIDSDEFREVLRLSHELQPWRPDELTKYYFLNSPGWGPIPFCRECADWHHESWEHSHVGF